MRPSASTKAATSMALPKACSEMRAPRWLFMLRQEKAEICLISITGWANQRSDAGCTDCAIQWSRAETIGHARVAAGLTSTGPIAPVYCSASGPIGTVCGAGIGYELTGGFNGDRSCDDWSIGGPSCKGAPGEFDGMGGIWVAGGAQRGATVETDAGGGV